ncbi:MAG: glycosyltransferase family 4 protein [Gemmatimonadales bacterium]|nr:glycosyltransferase family 4 protein [Gemmatimonadales bacterium]
MADAGRRRILLVEVAEDGTVGGSHQCLLDIVTHLDRDRFEPRVLFYQSNPFVPRLEALGHAVTTWDRERLAERSSQGLGYLLVGLPRGIARRAAWLRRERIDVVHLNNSPALDVELWAPACRLAGVRMVAHCRGPLRTSLAGYTLSPVRRRLVAGTERIMAISGLVRDEVLAAGVPADRVTVVYDGIDVRAWTPPAAADGIEVRREFAVAADDLLLLLPGNIKRWKGQLAALEAAALLPAPLRARMRMLLAGGVTTRPDDVAYARELERRIGELAASGGPRVSMLGRRADMRRLMGAADVVLHASVSAEPFGLVVVEALALGKPLVASALGGPSEIVGDAGLLADPADAPAYAAALERVLGDAALRASLASRARARAERFDVRETVREIESVYDGSFRPRPAPLPEAPRSPVIVAGMPWRLEQ